MGLMTAELEHLFEQYPIGSQEGKGEDAIVLAKFFNPCGAGTWLITEAERDGDDWLLFGYCYIFGWEWGYVSLSDLLGIRLPFGMEIERDIFAFNKTVKDLI